MKKRTMDRRAMSCGGVAIFLYVLLIFATGITRADGEEFELERSENLRDWESVPITPDILTEEGEIRMPANDAGVFFRLSIRNLEGNLPADPPATEMVEVEGGTLPSASELGALSVGTFSIGRYEVTWGEWKAVRAWAVENGYDLAGVGKGCGDDHPVHSVRWYHVVKWCNAKSEMENLEAVYTIDNNVYKTGQQVPVRDSSANGYRLPTEAEWEFAARGGNQSQGYTYSGSNVAGDVAWYIGNSGGGACVIGGGSGTWPVGQKAPNELGLHDMSGNVAEWCWDAWDSTESVRHFRGGSWSDMAFPCRVYFRNGSISELGISSFGFRLARGAETGGGAGIIDLSGDLEFGEVEIGESAIRTLTISNTGTIPLTVTGFIVPGGFSGNWSGTISANGTREVTVIFNPTEERMYVGDLTVQSDASQGTGIVVVTGMGAPAPPLPAPQGMTRVEGGVMPGISAFFGAYVGTFYIAPYEVTWREWRETRSWAAANGYDIGNEGDGCADNHPVHSVSWYDVVKWCNARSEKEGLMPFYRVNGEVYRRGEAVPGRVLSANGYRLPGEAEWEYAARGGAQSQGYSYSGSNDIHEVAWFDANSGGAACQLFLDRGTWPVGQKKPNELGLYDMSGNVWEWCWDSYTSSHRRLRGGSWYFLAGFCNVAHRNYEASNGRFINIGFRLARNE